MISRPKPNESEEDLLKLQDQFLQGTLQPAVSVLRADKRKADKHRSILSNSSTQEPGSSESSQKRVKFKLTDDNGKYSESITDATETVLADIMEKDTSRSVVTLPKLERVAFPQTFQVHQAETQIKNVDQKPRSLFAQQMMKKRQKKDLQSTVEKRSVKFEHSSNTGVTHQHSHASGVKSYVVDGSGLHDENSSSSDVVQQIHEENISKLQSLSEQEILSEQKKLFESLDPKLIEFLKSKRNKIMDDSQVQKSIEHHELLNRESMDTSDPQSHDSEDTEDVSQQLTISHHEEQLETEFMEVDISKTDNLQPNIDNTNTTISEEQIEEVKDDDLPIKLSEAKKWLHMDKLEQDKLLWTTNLPLPKPVDMKTGYSARFNFEGLLETQDSDVPTYLGLHHHGEDAELPGYTLEELFQYSRSSVPQQRILAFQIMTNIINKAQEGLYDCYLASPLLPQLLDAGIILLIRWAMDDKIEAVIHVAIENLHAILVNKADEFCLDRVFSWNRGYESHFLMPRDDIETSEEDQEKQKKEEKELKDADLIKLDVIKGLIRIDSLPRLRYILEVSRPPAPVVINILEILIRMARHSFETATKILSCDLKYQETLNIKHLLLQIVEHKTKILNHPRLISTIVTEFLPRQWRTTIEDGSKSSSVAYGVPVRHAVKLLRILASSGRRFASTLINKYQILEILICYIMVDPSEMGIPTIEAVKLSLESYRIWEIFLRYGFGCESYLDIYPVLMRQLQYFQTISVNMNVYKNQFNYDLGACFFGIFEASISVAALHSKMKAQLTLRNPYEMADIEADDYLVPPILNWSHVAGLFQPFSLLLKKWLWELTKTDIITNSSLNVIGSCFNVLAEYYSNVTKQHQFQAVEVLDAIEKLVKSTIIPFLHSHACRNLFNRVKEFSSLLVKGKPGFERDPSTLPSFGSIMWNGNVVPVLQEQAAFHFFSSFFRFCNEVCKIHHGVINMIGELVLLNSSVLQYLEKLLSLSSSPLENQCFTRYETHFVYFLLSLSSFLECQQMSTFHTVAIRLMSWLQVGDEHLAIDLATSIIFNPRFLPEQNDLISELSALKISRKVHLESVTEQPSEDSCIRLLSQSLTSLPAIRDSYLKCFSSTTKNMQARDKSPLDVNYFVIPSFSHKILNEDWFYLPISQLYLKDKKIKSSDNIEDQLLSQTSSIITHCLQWLYILKNWRTKLIDSLSLNIKYCYLATVFLIGNDLFLDVKIHSYLQALYLLTFDNNRSKLFANNLNIHGFSSFRDFYLLLLDQYEAVSYGDKLFGAFVIMPLQQWNDKQLRLDFWGEHICILRTLRIPLNQILDLEHYLHPLEDDVSLIGSYYQSALTDRITPIYSPLMYLVAIHHVHNFLFRKDGKHFKIRKGMFQRLAVTKNQVVKDHLIRYGGPDADLEIGFSLVNTDTDKQAVIDLMNN